MTEDIDAFISMDDVIGTPSQPLHVVIVNGKLHTTLHVQKITYESDQGLVKVHIDGFFTTCRVQNLEIPIPEIVYTTKEDHRGDMIILED